VSGIAALMRGLRVTYSDHDEDALTFTARNARLNGQSAFDTLRLDWNDPPPGLSFPVILASDLTYREEHVGPVVRLIKKVLSPDGECLLTDADRLPAAVLRGALEREGLAFTTCLLRAGEPGGERVKGTLYRITHALCGPA
jgi:hypothetical protein